MLQEESDQKVETRSEVVYVCVDEVRFDQLTSDLDGSRRVAARQALTMATIGHDLRQHVQTILLALDLVKCADASPERQGWLSIACDQANALVGGLEQLATEANLGAYSAQGQRSSFPIREVLDRIERKWRLAAAAKHLRFQIDRSASQVRSNPDLLTTVIDNLVSNAIKHTDRGSVGIYLTAEEGMLLISVQDTGPGIPSADMDVIFDPYRKGSEGTVGMGLGLAIVQSTASLLDHRVSVNSRVGSGSCFTVHVPLASYTLQRARQVDRKASHRDSAFVDLGDVAFHG